MVHSSSKFPRKGFTPVQNFQGNGSLLYEVAKERVHASMKFQGNGSLQFEVAKERVQSSSKFPRKWFTPV
jgi:hypothetical protein